MDVDDTFVAKANTIAKSNKRELRYINRAYGSQKIAYPAKRYLQYAMCAIMSVLNVPAGSGIYQATLSGTTAGVYEIDASLDGASAGTQ